MPNWCDNYITVECDNWEEIKEYCRDLDLDDRVSDFSFSKILPLEDNDASEYWGTKWDAASAFSGESFFNFQTAWGPSIPVTIALSSKFPDATFRHAYNEPGCVFAGFVEVKGGLIIAEEAFDSGDGSAYIEKLIEEGLDSDDNYYYIGSK
jgi:hypothetical protein